jgi:hypothetical protein
MRIWSLHPKYLDAKGLVALWRETLLAQKVLQGKTKGYKHHPQLHRFKTHADPLAAIATYLRAVAQEAQQRGYNFDTTKINPKRTRQKIQVTRGQINYEWRHLRTKLAQRDPAKLSIVQKIQNPEVHPLFTPIKGKIEAWEKLT